MIKQKGGKAKMKRVFLISCALMFTLSLITGVYAEEAKTSEAKNATQDTIKCAPVAPLNAENDNYNNSPVNKLGRGVANAATCWLEVPAEICRVSEDKGPILGYTLGFVEGVFTTLFRGATGIFDAVTFIIPPYNKPLMDPEYAIDSFGDSFRSRADAESRPE